MKRDHIRPSVKLGAFEIWLLYLCFMVVVRFMFVVIIWLLYVYGCFGWFRSFTIFINFVPNSLEVKDHERNGSLQLLMK